MTTVAETFRASAAAYEECALVQRLGAAAVRAADPWPPFAEAGAAELRPAPLVGTQAAEDPPSP